tara:strand:- start:4912 stop:5613 length:702 start_codon:yes stop_codon:yes gene_type:complete
MKATEIIQKFKNVLLSVTPNVEEEVQLEEVVQDTAIEVTPEVNEVELKESNEEVKEIEVSEEEEVKAEEAPEVEAEGTEVVLPEPNAPRVIERESSDVQLSDEAEVETEVTEELELSTEEVEENVEVELAEEAPVEEAPVEAAQPEYATKEELGKLTAEISALADLLNNMSPKKDVPQELSSQEIELSEEEAAEGIDVSPEADVKGNDFSHLKVPVNKGRSTQSIVWDKLFNN